MGSDRQSGSDCTFPQLSGARNGPMFVLCALTMICFAVLTASPATTYMRVNHFRPYRDLGFYEPTYEWCNLYASIYGILLLKLTKSRWLTFKAAMTVSWCFFTASWENSDAASKHMLSRARYLHQQNRPRSVGRSVSRHYSYSTYCSTHITNGHLFTYIFHLSKHISAIDVIAN